MTFQELAQKLRHQVTAITGLSKGSGKTTLLQELLPLVRATGPVAVATIGSSTGGRQDKRPCAVMLEAGDLVITTLPLAKAGQASLEVLDIVPGRAALGKLIVGRARRGGEVQLVGPEHFSALTQAIATIQEQRWAESILLDGAVNRITQVAGLGNVQFVYTAKVTPATAPAVAARLRMLKRLAQLPVHPASADEMSMDGPLTDSECEKLLSSPAPAPDKLLSLSLQDFTKVFLEPDAFFRLLKRCCLSLRTPLRLQGICLMTQDYPLELFASLLPPEILPDLCQINIAQPNT